MASFLQFCGAVSVHGKRAVAERQTARRAAQRRASGGAPWPTAAPAAPATPALRAIATAEHFAPALDDFAIGEDGNLAGLAAFWADDWTSETDPDTLAALRAQCSEEAERPDGAETHRWTGGDPLDATDPAYAFDSDDVVTIQRPDRFTLEADGWDNRDIPPPIPLDCADTPVPTATPSFARPAVEQMADKPVPRSRMTEADGPAAVRSEWSDPPALDFDQWCYTEDSASGPMPRPVTLKRWSLRRVLSACVLLAALLGAMSILTLFYSAKASDVTPVPVLPLNAREAKVLPLTTPLDTDEATRPRPDWWDRARDRWRQLLAGRNVQDTRRPRIRK